MSEIQPSLIFGAVTTLLIIPGRGGHIPRWRGMLLLALYAAYMALTLNQGAGHTGIH